MRRLIRSFGFAWRGLVHCLRKERHFRIHIVAAAYALILAGLYPLSRTEWAILLLTIGIVISAEALNTAIERAVDLGVSRPHPLAKVAKDSAAGAVLFCAVTAVAVGAVLFIHADTVDVLYAALSAKPWLIGLLAASVPAALLFIFKSK